MLAINKRVSRNDKLFRPEMWRNILPVAAYQVLVMVVLMFFGQFIFFEKPFNIITTEIRDAAGNPTSRLTLNTICFHCFMLMNIINMINARVLAEKNPFLTLCNNKYFWLVFLFEMGIQNLMVYAAHDEFWNAIFGVAPLTLAMQLTCWLCALAVLGVRAAAQSIELEKFNFMKDVNLEEDDDSANCLLRWFKTGTERVGQMNDQLTGDSKAAEVKKANQKGKQQSTYLANQKSTVSQEE